jgi:hypothetical protein
LTHDWNDKVFLVEAPGMFMFLHFSIFWYIVSEQGTHSMKTISEVSGTGRKPYKQKGTGRARHGTLRGPQFRGGATMHGPKPRSHAIKLQKKVRRLGLKVALSVRTAEGKVHTTLHVQAVALFHLYSTLSLLDLCFVEWRQGVTAEMMIIPWYLYLEGVLLSYLFVTKNKKCDVTSQDISGMSLWDASGFLCFASIFKDNEGIQLFQQINSS